MSSHDTVLSVRRALAVTLLTIAGLCAVPATSHADVCTAPVANPVACENSKPGTPLASWDVDGAGDTTIQGFGTSMSVNAGQTINFKIKSSTSNYHIDILRLGYYNGDGARLWKSGITPTGGSTQPACLSNASTGLIDCGNWSVSASWAVPSDAVSGVYVALLVRNDTGGRSQIPFVVRNDASHSDVVLQTSDATWEAYNTYGGNSLYQCTLCPPGNPSTYQGAFKVSYNRPFHTAEDDAGRSWLFTGADYSMIRFLERNGYDLSYMSSSDVASRGSLILNHKVFISSGHDEYWSASQRTNMEAARDAGVNFAFFTANEGFWKTRWEPSVDGSNTPDRTLVSYKDTHFTTPQDPVAWTGTWRDPRFTTPADGVTPENSLTGQSFLVNSGTSSITVPFAYKQMRLWRNTAVTNLQAGQSLKLATSSLGYEWDVDADNGFRPAGEFHLSATTVTGLELFTDYGSTTAPGGTATHSLTMYKARSGALVFGAGTVQWAWGLDSQNPAGDPEDVTMQQATVNLLADMHAQPATPMSGLVAASASTDAVAPTSALTSPPSSVADGTSVVLHGTASDTGGGVVAGVEVSTDGGSTWHPASGTTSWTYTWIAHGSPTSTIKVRAVDDSGNLETPGSGTVVAVTCPCSIWGKSVTPPANQIDSGDPTAVEVGVKFQADAYGTVSGLRFYKATTNTGTHTGSLWTASGQRLAQATFTGETASGWQTVTFDTPVDVEPNTTYVASYYAPNGHYAGTPDYFWHAPAPGPNGGATTGSTPLHALQDSGTTTNGVYAYAPTSSFPANSFSAGNYWVDVIYTPYPPPGPVSAVTATSAGTTSANVSWTAPATGGKVASYTITPYIGNAAQAPKTIDGSASSGVVTGLTNGTTYTFTVTPSNPNGSGPESARSNQVTPSVPVAPSAPTSVVAQPATQSARVSWNVPDANGDSPITGYTITPYIGSAAQTPVQAAASTTTKTLTGLTNGTAYTFSITATNAAGTSQAGVSASATPENTLLDFSTPASVDSGDALPAELGVRFKADSGGTITGVRFYKAAANTGTHLGTLWAADGTQLAQATFTGETSSGWQTATFASPVTVTAGTVYVVSYFTPSGHYSVTPAAFTSGLDNGLLHALDNSASGNGVYAYGSTSRFPTSTYNAANYFVDVMYAVPRPGQVTGVSAAAGGTKSVNLTWSAPTSGGAPTSYVITPYVNNVAQTQTTVSSGSATSGTVTGLTTGTTYSFTVTAANGNGAGVESARSNTVTPLTPVAPTAPTAVTAQPASSEALVSWHAPASDGDSPITGYTITPYVGTTAQTAVQVAAGSTSKEITGLANSTTYTFKVTATNAAGTSPSSDASAATTPQATILDFAAPLVADSGDSSPVELGVRFKSDFAGSVTGIRFYKAAANTGTHVGSLWSSAGTLLARATFTSESASGWQSVTFASPVTITPGTTYIASYFAPNGHYAVTTGGFGTAVTNGSLTALADGASGNGVYQYSQASAFPAGSYNASNYSVDVLFATAPVPGQPTGVTATAGPRSANVTWTPPSSGGPVTSYQITPYVGSTAQTATTITGTPPASTAKITGLTDGTSYTFTVRAANPSGSGPASAPSAAVTPVAAVAPGAPTGVAAQGDTKSAVVSWNQPATDGGSAITGYTVTPYVGTTAQTPQQVSAGATSTRMTGLTNETSYTFTVKATNAAGTSADSAASGAVVPRASLLDLGSPGITDSGDGSSVVLGVKFKADVNGSITGLRFYKAAANTGTHVGSLWSSTGTLLAQATFTNESASGWQTVQLATPVAVTAGTTYVAAYLAPNGHYSATTSAFGSGVDNGALHALATSATPNGVYAYSGSSVFPANDGNSVNYWVDLLFAPGGGT